MVPAREIVASLYGAYRLARADGEGLKFFNDSTEGFWRSFFAAVLVLPFYFVLLVVRHATTMEHMAAFRFYAVEMIAYVIAWVAFPLVMASLVRVFHRDRFYVRFIVAYNWAAVLQNGVYLPIAILTAAGLLSDPLANTLGLLAIAVIVVYVWFVTRVALEIEAGKAAGIVGLDFLLSILINAVAEGMI
jgi:hypothetical protein